MPLPPAQCKAMMGGTFLSAPIFGMEMFVLFLDFIFPKPFLCTQNYQRSLFFRTSILIFLFCQIISIFGQSNSGALQQKATIGFSPENYYTTTTEYTAENGLSGKFASYVFKDKRGLLWMTTLHGLHRFDGRDFKLFNNENYLPFNLVMEIYEDSEGYFWLYKSCYLKNEDGCDKTLAFFHPLTFDTLSFETRFGETAPFTQSDIEYITSNKKGDIFCIRTKAAAYRWVANKGFDKLPPNDLVSIPYVFTVLEDGRMGCYLKNAEVFIYYLLDPSGKIIFQQKMTDAQKLPEYFEVFPSTIISQYSFVNYRNAIRYESPDSFFVYQVEKDGRLNPDNLLSKIDLDLVFGARHTFFDQSTNTFWNADRRGVQRIELRNAFFQNVRMDNNSMMVRMTKSLEDGRVLIGGLMGMNHERSLFYYNPGHTDKLKKIETIENDAQIPSKDYLSPDNGFYPMSLSIILSKDGHFLNLSRENIFFKGTGISKFYVTEIINHQLWIGTSNGLWFYDFEKAELEKFVDCHQFSDFLDCSVRQIKAIDDDQYWVGTDNGLFLLSVKNGILEHYGKEQKGVFHLPVSIIYHFEVQDDGSILLATEEGLVHLVGKRKKRFENGGYFKLTTKEDGLPTNVCKGVYSDEYGFYWIITKKALVQMESATGRMRVYNKKNGLDFDYFNAEGHHKAPDGELYFTSLGGFVHFHPKDFKGQDFEAPDIPIIIVDFEQYNQQTEKFEQKTNELLTNNHITLRPKAKIFNLRVALADYRGADKHQFAYRIPGYQEEWQMDKSNLIRITGLPVGNHILEIKGRLEDGRFSSHILKIPITVLSEIYFRWWFILSALVLLAGLGIFLYKQRTRSLRNKQLELEKLVKERTQTIEIQTEELRSLDEMKSRFFANVSHELRTPLTLMLAPIQNTLKRNKLENRDLTNLLTAKQNGKYLEKMVNEILDLTKLEAGKLELKPVKIVWYNFLKVIVSNFESLANRKQIDYQFKYEGNKYLQVQIDPQKMETILFNLLSNAFKFTPNGKQILVHAIDTGENLTVEVKDTGRGIHPEDLPFVFDRFYQTKQKNAAAEGGTGIGLALTKEFVQLMKGNIEVESDLEKGAVFKVEIPKVEVISQLSGEEAGAIHDEILKTENAPQVIDNKKIATSQKTVILLVEDNMDLQDFIKSLLEPDYQIITADNGREALARLHEASVPKGGHPKLIISDIMMPFMDGYQFLAAVKSDKNYRHIPMIMLTSRAAMEDRLKALRIGVDDYLTKPFVQEELLARVENLLKNAEMRQTVSSTFPKFDEPQNLPTEEEQTWLAQLEQTILSNIGNFTYTLDDLAQDMRLSKRQLHRRINQLIGQTPNEYIKTLRLAKARELLKTRKGTSVKAIAYSVGFKDVVYFSKQFKKEFGKLPSEY
ncbi:MAG TPA: response regulator [Bacteroidetes bacterium]|nr:response regulator [Bacteroidota bacterium]